MKKIISVLMIAVLLLGLVSGCGKKAPAETTVGKPSGGDTAPAATTQAPAAEENEDVEYSAKSLGDGTCELTACLTDAKKVVIPETLDGETVVGIGTNAFVDMQAEEIILPDTVTYISYASFNAMENLKKVDLGKGLTTVERQAFNLCTALQSVKFPEGTTSLGIAAFSMCAALEEAYIPASVTEIKGKFVLECPNIVIVTPAGSAAEQVAIDNGLPVRHP